MLIRKTILLLFALFQIVSANRERIDLSQASKVDKLCSPSSIVNGTCTVRNKDIRLTYDFIYETRNNLIFDNTQVQCVTTTNLPCALHLKMTANNNMTLQNQSMLRGKQILIEAHNSSINVFDTSTLSVSGQSLNENGTQYRREDGAQFIGQGGACNVTTENYTVFGNYDMLPDFNNLAHFMNQMGSIGLQGDAETAGGGRMVILADSLNILGTGLALQANAKPFEKDASTSNYKLVGGSGGYIYVKTHNKLVKENTLGQNFRIEAHGGHGTNGYYGGSGGVIIFDGGLIVRHEQVGAAGGSSMKTRENLDGCGNGAAGTLFYRQQSKLIVDNENKPTTKKTVLRAPNPNQQGSHNQPTEIAKSIQVVGKSDLWIDANSGLHLKFDELTLSDDAILGIVTSNRQGVFTLDLGDQINISNNATLDVSRIQDVNITAANWWTNYSLGHVKYGNNLMFTKGSVAIYGNITLAHEDNERALKNSKVFFETDTLLLSGNTTIQAASIFAYTTGQLHVQDGITLQSYTQQSCATLAITPNMFSCVPMKSLRPTITQESFLRAYNHNHEEKASQIYETFEGISESFNVYLASETGIYMNDSTIHAPKIGLCAPNIDTYNTVLNAARKGCPSGFGIGQVETPTGCSGSGGSHGGHGGFGLPQTADGSCKDGVQKSYFDPIRAIYEGSSGSSSQLAPNLGGSGGGIIWLSASDTISLNYSMLTVRGQHGKASQHYGSGGGAGGSIQIITRNIAGDAMLDLSGGDGSTNGGGGGSGGRFVSHLLHHFNATSINEQSLRWNGTVQLDGGKGGSRSATNKTLLAAAREFAGDGQDGTTKQESCFGGFTGPFCKPCQIGTFKYNFGFGVCQPCNNKPKNSFYDDIAQSTAECSYQCVEGLETVDVNPQCLYSLDLQVERVGGAVGFLIVCSFLLIVTFLIWIIIEIRSNCIRMATKDHYSTVYEGVLFDDNYSESQDNEAMIGPANLQMRDGDIWSHTHRMYMIGENSISYPWFLTRDFPTNALSEQGKQKLLKYIKQDQYVLDWTRCQTLSYYIVRLLFPYWAEALHRSYRRKHFRAAATKLYESFDVTDWEDITGRTVRLSTDQDSRLAYIDFLDYRKNKVNFQGPQLPVTLLLAGNGTLSTPYTLNFLDDPLAKSLVYLNKELLKVKLPPFLQNLNTLLDKLCFYKFNRQTMKDLNDVIEWIELGNKTMFNQLNVKMQLYVFENSYQEIAGGQFLQRRRSMPLENKVFESFPVMFKRLIQHVQLKLLTKHSEIKLGLVVRSTSQMHERKIEQKIRKISEQLGGNNDNIVNFENATLSSLYDDDEDAGDFPPSQPKAPKLNYRPANRSQNDMSESLMSESQMETSQVMIHGTDIQTEVRIIDKSKRAYDISLESTKALEKALLKDKKRCKHTCARTKSVFYSTWILLFKLHGIPPTIRLNTLFLLFSITLALELVLTMIFMLHIFNPVSQVWRIGFAYLLILPGLTLIAPLWGLAATACGSVPMMKTWATMNTSMVALNYPLTLLILIWNRDQALYVAVILLLILNKMALSFYGSKVRQHFANPAYAKTLERMQVTLADMIAADRSGRSLGLTPSQRAAQLVQSGKPNLDSDEKSGSSGLIYSDDDDFGIVPTKNLKQETVTEKAGNFDHFAQSEPIQDDFDQFSAPTEPVDVFDEKPDDGPVTNSLLNSQLTQAASHDATEEQETVAAGEME